MSVLQSFSRKLRSWPKPGNSSQRVIALIFSILQDFIRVNMNTKTSDLLLDMCTHVTTLLLWMVCAAHLVYPSLQSVHQQSIRYWGTVVSGIVGHRAVTNLKVPNFCMICMIAFTRTCVLSNIVSSCTFISPHQKILKVKFTGMCMYTLLPLNSTSGYSDVLTRKRPSYGRFCSINIWTAQI